MNNINLRKNAKGISLIVLIVTIVVILILATAIIQVLIGDDNILGKAESAVQDNNYAQKEQGVKLAVMAALVPGKGIINEEDLNNELREVFKDQNIKVETIGNKWYYDGFTIDQLGGVEKYNDLIKNQYFPVEYIESTGKQYFVLDLVSTQNFGFDIDLYIAQGTGANVFGGYIPNGYYMNAFCYMGTRNSILSYFPNQSQVNYTAIDYGNKHNYKFIKTSAIEYSYYYDDVLVGKSSLVNNVGCRLAVFSFIDNDGVTRMSGIETFKGRIYKFILYEGEEEICKLIPCIRVEDDKIGMYDIVNDRFYSNESGVEDFISGPITKYVDN